MREEISKIIKNLNFKAMIVSGGSVITSIGKEVYSPCKDNIEQKILFPVIVQISKQKNLL